MIMKEPLLDIRIQPPAPALDLCEGLFRWGWHPRHHCPGICPQLSTKRELRDPRAEQ